MPEIIDLTATLEAVEAFLYLVVALFIITHW